MQFYIKIKSKRKCGWYDAWHHTTLMTAPAGRSSASRLSHGFASHLLQTGNSFYDHNITNIFGTKYFTTGAHFITICRLIFRSSQFFMNSFFFHMGGHMKKLYFSSFSDFLSPLRKKWQKGIIGFLLYEISNYPISPLFAKRW